MFHLDPRNGPPTLRMDLQKPLMCLSVTMRFANPSNHPMIARILWQYEPTNTLRLQLMATTLPSQSIASSPLISTSNRIRNTHSLLQNRYQMNNLVSSRLTSHSHSPPPPSHTSIHTPTTPRSTHSGRRVHFPPYFSHHV